MEVLHSLKVEFSKKYVLVNFDALFNSKSHVLLVLQIENDIKS